jgi:hypothetical protein
MKATIQARIIRKEGGCAAMYDLRYVTNPVKALSSYANIMDSSQYKFAMYEKQGNLW